MYSSPPEGGGGYKGKEGERGGSGEGEGEEEEGEGEGGRGTWGLSETSVENGIDDTSFEENDVVVVNFSDFLV